MKKLLIVMCILILSSLIGCDRAGTSKAPAESPEEIVKKFYAYIHEGGPTTIGEAYKLISTKHYTLPEDRFRDTVAKYSKDMKIDVTGSKIMKDRAVVTIEYKVPSAFGGDFVSTSEINLDLDEKANCWRIDFTGETQADVRKEPPSVGERKE